MGCGRALAWAVALMAVLAGTGAWRWLAELARQEVVDAHAFAHPLTAQAKARKGKRRPNIVLLTAEDMSSKVGSFGDGAAHTPHLDALAAAGVRFTNVHVTAPVCAPSRSSLWSGVHQNTLGTQNMRTNVPGVLGKLGFSNGWEQSYESVIPDGVRSFTELLRENGYFVVNSGYPMQKTDYQWGEMADVMWDIQGSSAHWRDRPSPDVPFFFYWNTLVTHESGLCDGGPGAALAAADWSKAPLTAIKQVVSLFMQQAMLVLFRFQLGDSQPTRPGEVRVPAFLPDTRTIREQIARQYNNVAMMDAQVGVILDQLKADGLWDDTVVIWTTDHGDGLPRSKRHCYEGGSKVPLIFKPSAGAEMPRHGPGSAVDDLVSFVDVAPTVLALAGVPRPSNASLAGRVFLGPQPEPAPQAVFCATDRFDSNVELRSRAVRTKQWKLIHNLSPGGPVMSRVAYREQLPSLQEWRRLHDSGALEGTPADLAWASKPEWELYSLDRDPDEVDNLAASEPAQATLRELQHLLADHLASTGDLGIAMTERKMVDSMMNPDGRQPTTPSPVVVADGAGEVTLQAPAGILPGSVSIVYRYTQPRHDLLSWLMPSRALVSPWFLYHDRIQPRSWCAADGERSCRRTAPVVLQAKAARYGYRDSPVVSHPLA